MSNKERTKSLLRRFGAYLDKLFDFPELALGLRDSRVRPHIPTSNVWLSVFAMFALRLRSFNALEQELRLKRRWESFVGDSKPSADTIGRVLSQFSNDQLRQFVITINRTSWRNKAIHTRVGESYRVVAVDGHELWSSRARCCRHCLIREVKAGERKVKEYYHRIVVAQFYERGCQGNSSPRAGGFRFF